MAKYNYGNYTKLTSFIDPLPIQHREQFQAIVVEGQLLAGTSLQACCDVTDISACSVATVVVMRRAYWLQLSGFLKAVQSSVEDLPFDGSKFAHSTD